MGKKNIKKFFTGKKIGGTRERKTNKELNELYTQSNIITVKSNRLR